MDDYSCMYQDSLEGLHIMDYCNEIEGFINYTLSNPRNIGGAILNVHLRGVRIKKI